MSKFQSKIINEYKKKGYKVINLIKLSENGMPDLMCLKGGKTIFIECKELNDKFKTLQKYKIDELISLGFEAFCVRDKKGIIYPDKTSLQNN